MSIRVIRCKKCNAPISVRSSKFGTKIPEDIRKEMKPINIDGLDKQLCAECER